MIFGFNSNASVQEIQNCIDYIMTLTKANEIKVTAGMFKDYTIIVKEYDLMKVIKEIIFE